MTHRGKVQLMIAHALRGSMGKLQDFAEEAGVSSASLRAWADGRRNPSSGNLKALADVLERRGGELIRLAEKLREAAE